MKTIYSLRDATTTGALGHGTEWKTARPENAKSLVWRIKAAWQVLKGKAVPLEWI